MSKRVFVGMSGGVDSSLSAALLKEQGWDVTGVYMKNWTRDLPGFVCPWKEDFQDAKTVAVQLGIDFLLFDFETEYRQLVVDYMVRAYREGLTPNPDVVCNQEVKFKLFLEAALSKGADFIATGHYARTDHSRLKTGVDKNKDQSYFLYRVNAQALTTTLFPLGEMSKDRVRIEAARRHLATAAKPDSQGICFVGEVGIRQFLLHELGPQPSGPIIDQYGQVIGEHDGAIFYTIGQRHGLSVGGGLPYYVTHKDMASNSVYVTSDLNDASLWGSQIKLCSLHWINGKPELHKTYQLKTRYRAPGVNCSLRFIGEDQLLAILADEVRAISPGQSGVIYDKDVVVGGGIIQSGQ